MEHAGVGVWLADGRTARQIRLSLAHTIRAEIAGFIAQSLRGETLPCRYGFSRCVALGRHDASDSLSIDPRQGMEATRAGSAQHA
jgi:hypothetical protein